NRQIFSEIRSKTDTDISYTEFMMNVKSVDKLADKALVSLSSQIGNNLQIYNRTRSITIDDFLKIVEIIKYDADLIVIDHLHYFDWGDEAAERLAINRIMRVLKQVTDNLR